MGYFPVDQALPDHPKVIRVAVRLGISQETAVGHLIRLWAWAVDYAPDGDLSDFDPTEIAAAARYVYPGLLDPDVETAFVRALREAGGRSRCGFVCREGTRCGVARGQIRLHDWSDWAGAFLERRRQDAERKRAERAASADRPTDVLRDGVRKGDIGKESKERKGLSSAGAAAFDRFWAVYPRHEKRRTAETAFARALDRAKPAEIQAGAQRYRDDPNREPSFTQHASTWLNADGWLSDPLPPRSPNGKAADPQDLASRYKRGRAMRGAG